MFFSQLEFVASNHHSPKNYLSLRLKKISQKQTASIHFIGLNSMFRCLFSPFSQDLDLPFNSTCMLNFFFSFLFFLLFYFIFAIGNIVFQYYNTWTYNQKPRQIDRLHGTSHGCTLVYCTTARFKYYCPTRRNSQAIVPHGAILIYIYLDL